MERNYITSNGTVHLLKCLKEINSSIDQLLLGGNEINDEAMSSLGYFLMNNQNINHVGMENNLITDKGIDEMHAYLKGNTWLHSIDFSLNKGITVASVPLFLKIIENSNLSQLKVDLTLIPDSKIFLVPLVLNSIRVGAIKIDLKEK